MRVSFNSGFCLILLFVLIFSNCTRNTNVIPEDHYLHLFHKDSISTEKIMEVLHIKTNFDYFQGKGHFTFESDHEELESSLQLNIVHDSALLMTSKKLGVEIARMLVCRDEYKLLDRIDKSYTLGTLKDFKLWNILVLSQQVLEDILTVGFHFPKYMEYKTEYANQEFTVHGKSATESIRLTGDPNRLLPGLFIWKFKDHTLEIKMERYQIVNQHLFPGVLQFRIFENGEAIINVQLHWKDIADSPIQKLTFNIPDHYTLKSQ